MTETEGKGVNPWRAIGWGGAALLLLLPAVAMQFTDEVNWTAGDFLVAALLLGVVGLCLELAVRASRSWAYRVGAGFAVLAGFLIVFATGAVGMIGDEGDPYNLYFLGLIPLALVGAVLARFRAGGMALAMAVTGFVQIGIALGGLGQDQRGAILSALLASLWLLSAALFRNAARDSGAPN